MWWLALLLAAPAGETRKPSDALEEAAATELAAPALELGDYFADGPFRPLRRALESQEPAAAVRLLKQLLREHPNAAERPQARYLLGLALIRAGDYEEAARLFDELALAYPLLKQDHLFFRGQALYLWGSYLDAAAALAAVDPDGPRGEEARRLRAWALLHATDFARLARFLEGEQRGRGRLDPELTYLYARARHRTGDVLGAYRGFREVWREASTPELSGPALLYLAGLKIGDKGMLTAEEQRVILGFEGRLRTGRDFDQVMEALEKRLPRTSTGLRAEIAYGRGRIAAAQGRVRAAAEHFARAQREAPVEQAELRARAAVGEARAAERMGDESRALAAYTLVTERFGDLAAAEEALFSAAEIQLRSRKYEEARDLCEALLLKNPVTTYRRRCLWSAGWGHFRLGQYERAREFFAALEKMELAADLEGASAYWLGRSLTTLGRSDEAKAVFKRLVDRYPMGYYSALAEDQLAEALAPLPPPIKVEGVKDVALPEALKSVREYVRLGLRDRARKAALDYEAQARKAGRLPEPIYHGLARLYDEVGLNTEARRLREEGAREHSATLGEESFVAAARRAHPLKYEQEIRSAAAEFGVLDSLLFGLIRTESGFRTEAVSAMEAYGLAQLILPTARQVSARIKAGRITKQRLLRDPATNVRLGAAYLRELLDRYDGSEPLALAAYNAGPNAVDAWLERRVRRVEGVEGRGVGLMPGPDELAEEIPVAETRAFVKVVLARARSYGRLYPRPAPAPEEPAGEPDLSAYAEPEHVPAPPRALPELAPGTRYGEPLILTADDPLAKADLEWP